MLTLNILAREPLKTGSEHPRIASIGLSMLKM